MGLSKLGTGGPSGMDALAGAGPVILLVEDVSGTVRVVEGGAGIRPGSSFVLEQVEGAGGASLKDVLTGLRAQGGYPDVPASGPGSVLMFDRAAPRDGRLLVGRVTSRVHDAMDGRVQLMRLLARPGRLRVSEHGCFQFVDFLDPTQARLVGSAAELREALVASSARDWPGGRPGFLFRTGKPAGKATREELATTVFVPMEEKETADGYVRRLDSVERLFSEGPVEAVPYWSVPVGREQMTKEGIDLKTPRGKAVEGAFSSGYLTPGPGATKGFRPTYAILSDEEEWAFRAKTGRKVRTCTGLQPISAGVVTGVTVATSVRNAGKTPLRPTSLHRDAAALDTAASARAARSGVGASPPVEGPGGPSPTTKGLPATVARRPLSMLRTPAGPTVRRP